MLKDKDLQKEKAKVEKFVLRLPEGMRADIAELAEDNMRSMNSQMIYVLREFITHNRDLSEDSGRSDLFGS